MKKLFVIALCIYSFSLNAQIITTFAGDGTAGYSGDGGPATLAKVDFIIKTVMDNSGNLYMVDWMRHCVRKVSVSGIITTVAGNGTSGYSGDGGPATAALLNAPEGIAVDGAGNIYIADVMNSRVRKVNAAGIITTIAGTGVYGYSGDGGNATAAQLGTPRDVALDAGGNIYIADADKYYIRKINTSGIISTIAGNGTAWTIVDGGAATASSVFPRKLAIDNAGNIIFNDQANSRIRKITPSGILTTIAGTGVHGFSGDGGPATAAQVNQAAGIMVDALNNIYISDQHNSRVRRINNSGIISTVAGNGTWSPLGDGGPPLSAAIANPFSVTISNSYEMYVSSGAARVRKITPGDAPAFIGGKIAALEVCENAAAKPINSLLAVIDPQTGQTITWTVISPASHGTASASYSVTSTGSSLVPVGLSYVPTAGYVGNDDFKVSVNDGTGADTVTVNVTVKPLAGCVTKTETISPAEKEEIKIYPNPSSGSFAVSITPNSNENVSIIITNMLGEKVKEIKTTANKALDMNIDLPSGVYVLSVITTSQRRNEPITIIK